MPSRELTDWIKASILNLIGPHLATRQTQEPVKDMRVRLILAKSSKQVSVSWQCAIEELALNATQQH